MEYPHSDMTAENLIPLNIDDTQYQTTYTKKYAVRKRYTPPDPNLFCAVIPGVILSVNAREGKSVKNGDSILVLEAMKMKNDIRVTRDAVIKKIFVSPGDQVPKGAPLFRLAPEG
jgi:biotin carboxyl carrier protein